MNLKNSQSLWAGGFIYHPFKKKVLLHLRDYNTEYNPGKYAFFGGTAEGVETARQCCSREWEEELGIRISPKELSPLAEYVLPTGVTRSVFYLIQALDMADVEIMEGAGARWVSFDELSGLPCTKYCIQDLGFFQEILEQRNSVSI